ncbi:MAG TPA: phosphoribosyltransferase family protein [Terriglobia bacterium]|nr:phosphoribosyltransferase family protein [Terriglobia bacterium]
MAQTGWSLTIPTEQMNADILKGLPAREGHFLLESGYHTDLWLTLDALSVSPHDIAPLIRTLAARLRPHDVSGVCGPLVGGAFLAQALATELDVDFYFTAPAASGAAPGLFGAEYRMAAELQQRVRGRRIALVDDVISAGSSVRATAAAVAAAGGSTAVVGTLLVLGTIALEHFAGLAIPVESLAQRHFSLWEPSACPLCGTGMTLEDPLRPQ